MIFLKRIRLEKAVPPLKRGLEIVFENSLTLVTGRQGSGKSTLLNLVSGRDGRRGNCLQAVTEGEGLIYFMDSEHDNPRIGDSMKSHLDLAGLAMSLNSRERSHGEVILEHVTGLLGACANEGNAIVLLDEPEAGLSMESVSKVAKAMKRLSRKNQLIAVTHHPLLLAMPEAAVYDLGKSEWIDGRELVRGYLGGL